MSNHTLRDCVCPRARHQHGTRQAYERDRCRCFPCRVANARHKQARDRRIAERAWNGGSDWAPAEPHILMLRALAADGWTHDEIGAYLHVGRSGVSMLMHQRRARMRATTAEKIRAAYDALGIPEMTPRRRKSRTDARRYGWKGSLDIEMQSCSEMGKKYIFERDDLIDEIAVERAMRGEKVPLNRAEMSDAIATLNRMGHSAVDIAARLGVSDRTIVRRRNETAA